MSKNQKPTSQQQAPQEEKVDENLESTENQMDGAGAGNEHGDADTSGTETGGENSAGEQDLASGADQDAAQLEAALAQAAAASQGAVEVAEEDAGVDEEGDLDPDESGEGEDSDGTEVEINDSPETAVVEQEDRASVADAPVDAVVATLSARAPSVTLNPVAVKVDVKTQQENIKFQLIIDRLQDYADKMAPNKAPGAAEGKAQQLSLWKTILMVLQLEGTEFVKAYGTLLAFVNEHRNGALNERYYYRWFPELAISAADRRNFDRMLNLMVATCDPATRRLGLQQVDLVSSVAGFRDGAIQQRVTEFYSL